MGENFLQRLRPNGPWTITTIVPDQKTTTETFTDLNECSAFIIEQNKKENIYYSVAVVAPSAYEKKAAKTEIVSTKHLHVDADPEGDETPEAFKERFLRDKLHLGPQPTFLVDSGNGFQLLWELQDIFELKTPEDALEIELRNHALAVLFGADPSTRNIDRILRVPGTTNWPNEKKRNKGRVECLSTIVQYNEVTYPLESFPKSDPSVGSTGSTGSSEKKKGKKGDLPPKLVSLLCVVGSGGFASRSELMMSFVTTALREGFDDETIARACLDSTYKDCGIWSHVQENGGQNYILRQVSKARAKVEEPQLAEMNDKYAVVTHGGKVRVLAFETVIEEEDENTGSSEPDGIKLDKVERQIPQFYSAADFRLMHDNKQSPKKGMGRASWWLRHPLRTEYSRVVFMPGKEKIVNQTILNLWRGWGINPAQGEWNLIKQHIDNVLACGIPEYSEYIIKWTAWSFQNPGNPPEVALVFPGSKGVGKGCFGRAIRKCFGVHGLQITSHEHLTGRFNRHLTDCAFLFADEAFWPGDKSAEGTLKRIITEPTLMIEPKGFDARMEKNHLHTMIAANSEWIVPASIDERRFAVFQVSEQYKQDTEYFKPLYHEFSNGGLPAMMFDMLNMDLTNWHPRQNIPKTSALLQQKDKSLSSEEQFWLDLLISGELPRGHGEEDPLNGLVATAYIHEHARRSSPRLKIYSSHQLNTMLIKFGANRDKDQRISRIDKRRAFEMPSLKEAREKWDKDIGSKTVWNNAKEWEYFSFITTMPGSM